ncbi:MAG: enoyl-CoA hydratase/isomerase family protein [Alphaproteobacteria bacterium]|nr:enoyl-CoA hydratase/isomerase family protein [Alphaproteobacteria bacterium]
MTVHLARTDEFALLTLDRPEALNALNCATLRELDSRLDEVAAGQARALFVTGAGDRAFCAGADIKELMGRSMIAHRRGIAEGQRVISRFATLPVPSVALINGYAFGGGLELAMACNFRLALRTARLGLPEIKLGVIPGYGGTQRLARLVGEARALDIVMTGRTVRAGEAERIGLVHRLVDDDLLDAGKVFAREMTRYGLPALALARDAVARALDHPLDDGLKLEADLNTLAFQTEDATEGLTAFIEKRKPAFRDK